MIQYLVDEPSILATPSHVSWASPIYEAVLSPTDAARRAAAELDANIGGYPDSLANLRGGVATVMQASLLSDYTQLAHSLPSIIGRIELANLQACDDDRLRIQRLISDVYAIAGCLAEVHMRAKSFQEAIRTAFLAATCLDTVRVPEKGTVLCLRGAALLSAAAASARRGDRREAHTALKAADVCAAELNGHIPKVNLHRMPSHLAERRARFLIDVARSHTKLRDDTAALDALLHAEAIAPDELHNHRLTHEVVRELLSRERRSSGLRALATRCMLLN